MKRIFGWFFGIAFAVVLTCGRGPLALAWGPTPVVPSPAALASAATGTTAFTYVTLQSHATTCGYSPSGLCLVLIQGDMQYPIANPTALPTTAGYLTPCIYVSSTPSPLPSTLYATYPSSTTAPCASSAPANALAGGSPFGFQTAAPSFVAMPYEHVAWNGTMPDNQTLTFIFAVEGSSTTSETVQGSSSVVVIPY